MKSEPVQFDNPAPVGLMGARLKELYCVFKTYITTSLPSPIHTYMHKYILNMSGANASLLTITRKKSLNFMQLSYCFMVQKSN
jgi:hypothetical protein